MNYFDDVAEFHVSMGLPVSAESMVPTEISQTPTPIEFSAFNYRLAFLFEEIRELIEGNVKQDLAKVADALVDIVWVALGTAHYAGIPFDALWEEVKRANMEKRPWKEGDPIKPRNALGLEVVKPDGWRPPDIDGVLRKFRETFGWREAAAEYIGSDGE